MKINRKKICTMYSTMIGDSKIEYGWFESGKAFIAKDEQILTFAQAYKELVPKSGFNTSEKFYIGLDAYPKTTGGIIRYLIHKYNR